MFKLCFIAILILIYIMTHQVQTFHGAFIICCQSTNTENKHFKINKWRYDSKRDAISIFLKCAKFRCCVRTWEWDWLFLFQPPLAILYVISALYELIFLRLQPLYYSLVQTFQKKPETIFFELGWCLNAERLSKRM